MTPPCWSVQIEGPSAYRRAKTLLNAGRHPTFVGPNLVARAAAQGGLLFAIAGYGTSAHDAAVAVVNPRNSTLLVLNVHPGWRSAGLGAAFLQYLRPNFARVVATAVPWFQQQGYITLGAPKLGRRLSTQVMVREELIRLAGRAAGCFAAACICDQAEVAAVVNGGQKQPEPASHRQRRRP